MSLVPKLFSPGLLGLWACTALLPLARSATSSAESVVTVDLNRTEIQSFMGLGIQWDPYAYPPRPQAWRLTLKRLDFARPAFFRVMLSARNYCLDLNADNQPRYVWTEGEAEVRKRLGSLLDILDYAQAHNIEVLLGEWSPPGRLGLGGVTISRPDDPRWARLVSDFVTWLRERRGYSVIRMYNLMNEPNGSWMWPGGKVDYDAWAKGIRNLRKAFDTHGLSDLPIVGPDNSGGWDWIDRVSREMPECIGAWEMHWYARDQEIFDGRIEQALAAKHKIVLANDPLAGRKRFFLAEAGLVDGKCNGDQQPRVKTFAYGVMMADLVAQAARAGWMGVCAWDMDDAIHTVRGHPPIPNDKTLKLWGFWNTQGTAMGHPEDEDIRPWFYTWSLMTRLFPRQARIVETRTPNLPRLRVLAGTTQAGRILSVMLVNEADEARALKLVIPAAGRTKLQVYHYFEHDRPTDSNGLPIPKETLAATDLESGISLALPARSVVFLTTK